MRSDPKAIDQLWLNDMVVPNLLNKLVTKQLGLWILQYVPQYKPEYQVWFCKHGNSINGPLDATAVLKVST